MREFKILLGGLFLTGLIACGESSTNQKITKTNDSAVVEEATKSEEKTIEINGVNHFVKIMGTGKPIIILHGGPGLFHNYLVDGFKSLAKNHQLFFYDQRGCGKTDFPTDTTSINIENYVEDLNSLINELKLEKPHIIGHSWGSVLAVEYAKKYQSNIDRLVLASPAPINEKYFDQMYRNMQRKRTDADTKDLIRVMGSKEFEQRNPETFKKAIMLGDKANLIDQGSIEKLYSNMEFTKANANNMLLVNGMLENDFMNSNFSEGLDLINNDVLILSGDMDNVPFASTQELSEKLPNARIEVISKSCHYPFFENNKKFLFSVNSFLSPEYE